MYFANRSAKLKTIQSKIICITIAIILLTSICFVNIGLINNSVSTKLDTDTIITLATAKAALQYDEYFYTIEDSVDAIHEHALQSIIDNPSILESPENLAEYTNDIFNLSLSLIDNIKGASSVYYEYNPDIYGIKTGFWITFDEDKAIFSQRELFDFTVYDEDDERYAIWFYEPMKAGKAIWVGPYYDYNVEQNMYTYANPVIYNDTLIGVIAMDINTDVLQEIAESIEVYMDGNAFITDKDKNLLYSYYYPEGCPYEGLDPSVKYKLDHINLKSVEEYTIFNIDYIAYMEELKPGMLIGINIPISSFESRKNKLLYSYILATILCTVVAIALAIFLIRSIVKPLRNLTKIAEDITNGDYNKRIPINNNDEVGVLAKALNKTLDTLNAYIKTLDEEAKLDFLTGLSNKNAFEKTEKALTASMENGIDSFTVTVFDINNLKKVNDTYGHDAGDKLIAAVSEIIREVYGDRLSYRIGGDEFVAIIRNSNIYDANNYIEQMKALIEKHNKNAQGDDPLSYISVAIGAAVYYPATDKTFIDVFNRADKEMYKNKRDIKEGRK